MVAASLETLIPYIRPGPRLGKEVWIDGPSESNVNEQAGNQNSKNCIESLVDNGGRVHQSEAGLAFVIQEYFSSIFKSSNPSSHYIRKATEGISSSLSDCNRTNLGAVFRPEESKCCFGVTQVGYLGHLISGDGVQVDPAKTKALNEWPIPTIAKGVRGFLGLARYYQKFISGFGRTAALLPSY
ncbi:hypothetical protein LWI28_025189 [Acer negundo]|uniref:Reverse transcriptase n=1 Tax=Acer negundo TaxID=4023 RepID=A0AAD5NUY9_ACENE|nr:hypothetical protein LWI28_025189 [Acer negundo]